MPIVRHASSHGTTGSVAIVPRRQLFDTLAFTQRLVEAGVMEQEARAIATELAQVLVETDLIYASEVAAKSELLRAELAYEAKVDKCRSEMSSGLAVQKSNLEKLQAELRYEIEKLTSSQKLDLNLERGRTRDELQQQNDRIMVIDSRLEREVNLIRTQIEASKNDLLRYSVGTITAFGAVVLGVMRLMI